MNERDLKKFLAELDRLDREVVTPEQCRAHLLEMGMIDEDGQIAPQYRSVACQ